jgi:tRNA (guanine-N7-)-methyltransferase
MDRIKSFVLRSGRMSKAQFRSYEKLSGSFLIEYHETPVDFASYFGNDHPLIIEIGFGMGWATAEIAGTNPGNNYLGIEVFKSGIGRLLWEIETRKLLNIRIIEHDAAEALETMVKEECAAAFHIFFPDPWPKKRHQKRRLMQRPFTDLLASRLQQGGYIYMVTDWEDYGVRALEALSATPGLKNSYEGFAPKQEWRPQTKFERKGLDKNHQVREIHFRKDGAYGNKQG